MDKKVLDAEIPEDAISERSNGGTTLSYLTGAYVINRLNQVLGHGNWGYEVDKLEKVFEGKIQQRSGEVFATSYIAQVRLFHRLGDASADKFSFSNCFSDVGYGDGTDKGSPGKAHELAVKEAVTDALKRCAKNLGMSFGLQLYFKEGYNQAMGSTIETPKEEVKAVKTEKTPNIDIRKKQIKTAFAVLNDQKKINKDIFVNEYTKGKKVDELTEVEVGQVFTKLASTFPEMGLT